MNDSYSRPIPRLLHVEPGQSVELVQITKNQPEPIRRMIAKDKKYAYFENAKISLSCPVNPAYMRFGEGGWRVKP